MQLKPYDFPGPGRYKAKCNRLEISWMYYYVLVLHWTVSINKSYNYFITYGNQEVYNPNSLLLYADPNSNLTAQDKIDRQIVRERMWKK